MTTFQILTLILAFFGLLGSGLAAYIRLKTDIAKIQAEIEDLKQQRISCIKEISSKADHNLVVELQKETNTKLDQMNNQINIMVNKLIS